MKQQRVVMLDQMGRASVFYAAELLNGKWINVQDSVHITAVEKRHYFPPKVSRVNKVELGQWVSPTALEVSDTYLVDDIPVATSHEDELTAILQFSNGLLRVAN